MGGRGADAEPAARVVAQITASGGTATADGSDVSTPDGARALIDTAIERFGRVDVLVNNAGIIRWASLPDIDDETFAKHLAVHVVGSFNTARAAWPRLVEQRYGRIVMTTSAGLFGLPNNTAYAAAKGAVVGLTRSLHLAGDEHGIKVNAIAPAAWTRMAGGSSDPDGEDRPEPGSLAAQMSPDLVAPMVAYLAHEDCPVSGEVYAAGAGRFSRLFIASTVGYVHPEGAPTVDDVARNWAAINDESGYAVPADLTDWSAAFMAHLPPAAGGA